MIGSQPSLVQARQDCDLSASGSLTGKAAKE